MPFALFVSTEPINNRQKNYMTWEQIRALSEAGALIANHMVSHPYMLSRNAKETDANWLARQRAAMRNSLILVVAMLAAVYVRRRLYRVFVLACCH